MNFFKKFQKLDLKNKKDKKKLISFGITIIGIFLLCIGTSAAYLIFQAEGSTNTISAGTLALTMPTEGTQIGLTNGIPLTDATGLSTSSSYTFTLTNSGTISAYYEVSLVNSCAIGTAITISGTSVTPDLCIPNNYIKVAIKKDGGSWTTLSLASEDILDSGIIAASGSIDYELKIWLDQTLPNTYQGITSAGVSQNVVYLGKIQLYARQLVEGT